MVGDPEAAWTKTASMQKQQCGTELGVVQSLSEGAVGCVAAAPATMATLGRTLIHGRLCCRRGSRRGADCGCSAAGRVHDWLLKKC